MLSLYLSIYLSIYLLYLSIHLSIYPLYLYFDGSILTIYLFIYQDKYLFSKRATKKPLVSSLSCEARTHLQHFFLGLKRKIILLQT